MEFRYAAHPPPGDPTPEVNAIAESGADMWVFSAVDANSDVAYKSKVGYLQARFIPDYVPRVIELAHERDIAVISWFGAT